VVPLRIIVILLLLSLVLFAYPVWRLGDWLQLSLTTNLVITTPLFLSQVIARVLLRHRKGRLVYTCRGAADFFLGLSPILLLLVLVGELLLWGFQWPTTPVAYCVLATTAIAGAWGMAKAWTPDIVRVELSSAKLLKPLRFVQISDVHIGSRTARFLAHIIDLVNEQNPDFLCITGDFIDQPGISLEKLQSLTLFKGPIYYCIGNHERYEDLDDIVGRLESLGVEVLRNRTVEADGLQFIGIDDHESSKQVARVLPFIEVKEDLYSILLYHRPQASVTPSIP